MSGYDFMLWAGLAFFILGYAFTAFRAFDENPIWGWWVIAFPPLNLWYAYVIIVLDRKPVVMYAAALAAWAIAFLFNLSGSTAEAASWHGFELA